MSSAGPVKSQKERYIILDVIRGLAVLLMIIFHLAYDLSYFHFVKIDFLGDPIWFGLPRFIVFLFLICVGVSLAVVHKQEILWHKVRKRFFKIGGCALIVTGVTYILLPKNFVFFGTLHCIAVSSILGVFFVTRPKLSLGIGLLFVVSNWVYQPTLIPVSKWLDVASVDYIPIYPWIGIVLIGIYLESIKFHKIPIKKHVISKGVEIMGRRSLIIYLLHQPILFGAIYTIDQIKT